MYNVPMAIKTTRCDARYTYFTAGLLLRPTQQRERLEKYHADIRIQDVGTTSDVGMKTCIKMARRRALRHQFPPRNRCHAGCCPTYLLFKDKPMYISYIYITYIYILGIYIYTSLGTYPRCFCAGCCGMPPKHAAAFRTGFQGGKRRRIALRANDVH